MTADVKVTNITHRFGNLTALNDVSLMVGAGRFAVLLGPSGCGKTTLLSILGGFLTPSAGSVIIGGQDVTSLAPAKRPTTTMFQDYALFPHMNLRDNIGFGLRMRHVPKKARDKKAVELLELLGLPDVAGKKPHELSGGQRQRVALARALAVEPDVLLLDEPLGALDLKLRRQMQDELKDIQRRVGTTFIHVTHDQEEAMAIADDIIVMKSGQVQDIGPPEAIYLKPRNRFTASFMGEANFVAGTVRKTTAKSITIETAFGTHTIPNAAALSGVFQPNDQIEICIRPEHIQPDLKTSGAIDLGTARIIDMAFAGTCHRCHLRSDGQDQQLFTAHLPQTTKLRIGDQMPLRSTASDVIIHIRQG